MTARTYTNPPQWPLPPNYTHAVATSGGRLLFISGQVPLDATGQLVGGTDFEAQARQALDNLETVLTAAGASMDDVVKVTYFVVGLDSAKLTALRSVLETAYAKERRPAASLLGVQSLFREGVLIEIEAVAELPPAR